MTPWLELWLYPLGDVGTLGVSEYGTLHVGFTAINSYYTAGFDVEVLASEGIIVTGVRFRTGLTMSDRTFLVYTRVGTATGYMTSSSGWTLRSELAIPLAPGIVELPFDAPVLLAPGTHGFYITPTSYVGGAPIKYVSGTPVTYADSQAEITTYGVGVPNFATWYSNYRADVGITYEGGWHTCTITTPAPVSAALAELAALATAWSPGGLTYAFSVTRAGGLALSADGDWQLALSATMADLLGISTLEQGVLSGVAVTSDQQALAFHAPIGIGYQNLREIEAVELREYSHGRTSAYLSRHGRAVDVRIHIDVLDVDAVLEGPLGTHGLTRLYPTDATAADAYDRDHLTGYLDCYPVEVKALDRPRWGDTIIGAECVIMDAAPAVVIGRRQAQLAAALPFGFGFVHIAQIDGIAVLFIEREYDAAAPEGYTLDASLVIDDSARLGSLVDREETGNGHGFSLTLRLLDTAAVRGVFRAPAVVSWLTSALTASATTIPVQNPASFSTLSPKRVYVGTEAIPFTSISNTAPGLIGATRGAYGPGLVHAAGTPVADRPLFWPDRRIRLWAVAVDPTGRIVTSDGGLLTDAALVWSGHVGDTGAPSPRRVGGEWEIVCEPLDRRLKEPIGVAVTGQARWTLDADPRSVVSGSTTIWILVEGVSYTGGVGVGTLEDVALTPFASLDGEVISLSRQRQLIEDAWTAQHSSIYLGELNFKPESLPNNPLQRIWRAWIQARRSSGVFYFRVRTSVQGATFPGLLSTSVIDTPGNLFPETPTSLWNDAKTGLYVAERFTATTLEVAVTRGDPNDLPASGWVELEGKNSGTRVLRYTSISVGEDGIVRVQISPGYTPDLASLAADAAAGEVQDLSARFTWGTSGTPANVMRTLLESSGRGDNGAFDTLPKGQGYDLANVDEASFDEVLDGLMSVVGLDLAIDSRTSFAALFGGLLTLSERAIVARANAVGDAIELAAIHVGPPGVVSRANTVTVQDRHLVYDGTGQKPVRALISRPAPRVVEIAVKTTLRGEALNLVETDVTRARGQRWTKSIYGVERSVLVGPVGVWSLSLFRQQNVQALEINIVPWLDVVEGDEIALELSDIQLWQYSTGTPGYTGPGRVIGRQMKPGTQIPMLTVLADGIQATTVLSPSAPIVDYTGTSSAPTAVKVPREYYQVFRRYLTERDPDPLYLRLYAPGSDNRRVRLDIDDVADDGTHCVLSVSGGVGTYDLDTVIYAEDFEADAGDWIETLEDSEPGGTSGIQRHTGTTPSSGTGPPGAYSGSYYMYFESSSPMALNQYELTLGPAVSLQGATKATLTFARHMYSSIPESMGTLSCEVSGNHGETWETLWSQTGDQGNQWDVITVDLAAYLGEVIRLRIRCATANSGTSYLSDMAWDEIRITVLRHHVTNPTSTTDESTTQRAHLHVDTDAVWS